MKRITSALLLIAVLIVFSGCGASEYQFLHPVDEITEIAIVDLTLVVRSESEVEVEYTTAASITDTDTFIDDFNSIVFHTYLFGESSKLTSGFRAIMLVYENGDREYICPHTQMKIIDGIEYTGRNNCSDDDFEKLIKKYVK
ncbi:MAG: hypothetical protein E7617_02910 [Ruminococcaceae bacterium]|nr:hypothetical protein [Oscillospiraceae bacterium]